MPDEIAVKRQAGWRAVDKLNRPDLDDAMAAQNIKAGRLGINDVSRMVGRRARQTSVCYIASRSGLGSS